MAGTSLAIIDPTKLDSKDWNVLHPIVAIREKSPILAESWSAVKIDPETVDTYHDFRFAPKDEGKHALTAVGLGKIAAAAGIRWVTDECRIEQRDRRPDGHIYIAYKAVGAVRQPNGEWFLVPAHQDLDTADELEELLDTKVRKWRRESKKGPGEAPPPSIMAKIQDDARRDIIQIRDNALALVETKAQNRVIRKLLSLSQVYTNGELAKPFAVPRLIYRPDLVDARSLEQIQMEGYRAAQDVYGGALGLPSSAGPESPEPDRPAATAKKGAGAGRGAAREASQAAGRSKSGGSIHRGATAGPSDPPDASGIAPHAFKGDEAGPCKSCGWAMEHPVHKTKGEQGTLA